jgi:hypothetical protein
MKSFLRSLVFAVTLFSILVGLVAWGEYDETIMSILGMMGAVTLAFVFTGSLTWFACWLAQPDESEEEETEDGNNRSDEKAGRDMDTNSGIDFHS